MREDYALCMRILGRRRVAYLYDMERASPKGLAPADMMFLAQLEEMAPDAVEEVERESAAIRERVSGRLG
jgi:hypothetical protein